MIGKPAAGSIDRLPEPDRIGGLEAFAGEVSCQERSIGRGRTRIVFALERP